MAYLETDKVKEIRKQINETFKKDGFKFSVTRSNYSGVNINLMVSPLDLGTVNESLNDFFIHEHENENVRNIFGICKKIITRVCGENYNRNAGDLCADYADYNYFKNFRIGKWDQDCKITTK